MSRSSDAAHSRPRWGRTLGAILGGCAAAVTVAAAPSAPPALGGPDVVKLDWNLRSLVVADFNGDQRSDIAVINNDRARIEMLLQRAPGGNGHPATRRVRTNRWEPELDDARYDRQPLTTGITAFDLAAGDLNGDGRIDLVYTGQPDGLTVRLQSARGDWDDKQVFDYGEPLQYLTNLRIADLDGDGRDDLLVLQKRELLILRQTPEHALAPPVRYALAENTNFSLELADVNGDGRTDVLYLAAAQRDGLRVRFQQADGSLGPEVPFRFEPSRTALEVIQREPGAPPAFACVQAQTSLLSVFALAPQTSAAGDLTGVKPRVFSTRTGTKLAPSYAVGDVDGDGRLDVAVADADGAQLLVYFQGAAGELREARAYPSLAEARGLAAADWDGDARAELFVVSAKEQVLGVARYTREGRLSYPRPLALSGRPLAIDVAAPAAGRGPTVAVAVEDGGKRRVEFITPASAAETGQRAVVELTGLRTDPRAVRWVDANQDGRQDVAVFVPFEAMRLLVQQPDGAFVDVSGTPGYRRGLVENLDPASFSSADVDGDGKPEMLVGGSGFARALRLDADGALQVADQFNARDGSTEIAAAFAADLDGDGRREVVLFDPRGEELEVLRRNEQGVFTFADTVPVSSIELVATGQLDLDQDEREDLFFFGKDRFWLLGRMQPDFHVDPLLSYETDLEGIRYGDLAVGDLTNDGVSDVLAIDGRENLVELLARDGLELKSVLHFRVFESDPHVQRRGSQTEEPRETLIADVTGDGRNDLVLLVHDRVLIYPQQ